MAAPQPTMDELMANTRRYMAYATAGDDIPRKFLKFALHLYILTLRSLVLEEKTRAEFDDFQTQSFAKDMAHYCGLIDSYKCQGKHDKAADLQACLDLYARFAADAGIGRR